VADKDIGRRLKELRKKRGLSQAEVGEKLGVHQSLVSEYERGTVRVPSAILAALAEILRASADEILGLKPLRIDGRFGERRFIRRLERIERLPKRAKQALLKTLDTYLDGAERR
jgi:transcriptional regulator with XRE-family HTH domain